MNCFLACLQVDAADSQEAEQKQQADQQAKAEGEEGQSEQPATLKKAQTAAAARKDGEEVGSSGQAVLGLPVKLLIMCTSCTLMCCPGYQCPLVFGQQKLMPCGWLDLFAMVVAGVLHVFVP